MNRNDYGYESVFPIRLRELMETSHTSQEQLAGYCGVKRQTVAKWKDGNTQPDAMNLKRIAEYFNVSADYLLGILNVSTVDIEKKTICLQIGLDEESVDNLIEASQRGWKAELSMLSMLLKDFGFWRTMHLMYKSVVADRNVRNTETEIILSEGIMSELEKHGISAEAIDLLCDYEWRDIAIQRAKNSIVDAVEATVYEAIEVDGYCEFKTKLTEKELYKIFEQED